MAFELSSRQVRAGRALLGWTQAELAQRAGVGRSTIDKIERLGAIPKPQYVAAIAAAFESAGLVPIDGDKFGGQGVRLTRAT